MISVEKIRYLLSTKATMSILVRMRSEVLCYQRVLILLFLMFTACLHSETVRSKAQGYFDTLHWEQWDDTNTPPLIEAYAMSERNPIAYAQIISETAVYPSLPSLGVLDYHTVPNDILQFCDAIAAGFVKKKLTKDVFNPDKPFLFHLVHFMLDKLPQAVSVFYSKPVVSQEGTAHADFRIITEAWAAFQQTENQQPSDHAAAEIEPITSSSTVKDTAATHRGTEKPQRLILPLFANETPYAIIIEAAAIQKNKRWYIDHIDIKGAEYASSSVEN